MIGKSPRQGPRQYRLIGTVLLLVAIVGGVGLLVIIFYPMDWSTSATGWASVFQTVASILGLTALLGMLAFLLHTGERHLAPTGLEVMRDDPRPPVLFLRSFETEPLLPLQEQILARIVQADVGPFIAIGNPNDRLPQLGAARFYERDFAKGGRSWQVFVRDLLLRARLVIIAPGDTTGLGWEISQCRELLAPKRLVVLISGDQRSYSAFRNTAAVAGLLLPDLKASDFGWGAGSDAVGIITFKSDWTASIRTFPPASLFANFDVIEQERRMGEALAPVIQAVLSR